MILMAKYRLKILIADDIHHSIQLKRQPPDRDRHQHVKQLQNTIPDGRHEQREEELDRQQLLQLRLQQPVQQLLRVQVNQLQHMAV